MDNTQRSKLDSYERVDDFNGNVKYTAQIATIPEYAIEKADFDAAYGDINKAAEAQSKPESGSSKETVKTDKELMAEVTVKYAMRASVKARQAGELTLANSLDEPESYILKAPKATSVQRAKGLRDTMKDNLAVLTNITLANITEISDAIDKYDKAKNEPIETIQTKKVEGTDKLPALFTSADLAIAHMIALIVSYFGKDSEIAGAIRLAAEIINTGIRHTSIVFTVLDDAGNALEGAAVSEVDGKSYIADIDGVVEIGSHRSGAFHFVITAPGKQKVTLSTKIIRGQENDFTVKLAAV